MAVSRINRMWLLPAAFGPPTVLKKPLKRLIEISDLTHEEPLEKTLSRKSIATKSHSNHAAFFSGLS
jgi:hypothetical protein